MLFALDRSRLFFARYGLVLSVILAIGFGLNVRSRSLQAYFFSDDYDHFAMRAGLYPVARDQFDMFNFSAGSRAENDVLVESGQFPWWTDRDLHLSMWRPLSSALTALDAALFGKDARAVHVHSALWFGLLIVAAACVLGQLLPMWQAAVAILLFALEEGHTLPLGWVANRSALVATAAGFAALAFHLRFTRHGLARDRLASILCWLVALGAGEYTFSVLGYFLAYEVARTNASARSTARALWPFAAVAGLYLVLRHGLGYGISRSGIYISPTATPLSFLTAASWRIPVLMGDLALGINSDWYVYGTPWKDRLLELGVLSPALHFQLPSWPFWQTVLGICALTIIFVLLRRLSDWIPQERARTVRWLVAGSLLALIPVAGTMVSPRLLVAASLGCHALFAELIVAGVLATGAVIHARWRAVAAAVGVGLLLYLHAYEAAVRSRDDAGWFAFQTDMERDWVLEADLDPHMAERQEAFIIAATDVSTYQYLRYILAFHERPAPYRVRLLSGAKQPHDLYRVADNAFELWVLTADIEHMARGSTYRPEDSPLNVGDEVRLQGMHTQVIGSVYGQPVRTRFTFGASIDDPRYAFLYPTDRGLRRVAMPPIGARIRLKLPQYPNDAAIRRLRDERERSRREGYGGAIAPYVFETIAPR